MARPVIIIDKLSKRYPGQTANALSELSLSVGQGEVYGFLGPNGAGKSTTIRLLLNFLQPTSGTATINSLDIVKDTVELKKSIGYLSSDFAIYPKMTGAQYLSYLSSLQSTTYPTYQKSIVKRLQADLHRSLGSLSRGNRQKIGIIQAFSHKPEVLILDEPTSGLDPLMQEVFYELIHEAKGRGATVFMSSHILGEVQKVCDRVGIIKSGSLVVEKSIDDLKNEASQIFDITFRSKTPLGKISKIKGVSIISSATNKISVRIDGELSPLLAVLAGLDVVKLDARSLDLEEMFLDFYEHEEAKP